MSELALIEKQCVGCGNEFLCPTDAIETVLYCTSTCEENHSIFDVKAECDNGASKCS